jgi:hypothetical protein
MAENRQKPTASNKYSLYSGREEAVNWGQVAVDLTKGLEGIRDSRAAAKQKIIDDTNAAMDKLSEIADLQAPSMNSLIIDGSDFSKNTLQANMDLVKRGLLDPKDYMLIMQQQKDGYKSLSNYAKNYDAKYKEGIERIKNGEASNLEEFFRGTGFSFGNTKNKKLWSDPATGQLLLVEMEPDPDNPGQFRLPSREKNPGAYTTPASMLNLINFQENSRDLNEDVANLVTNNLAEVVTSTITSYSVLSGGKDVKSIEDFRQLFDDVEGEGFTDAQGNKMTFDSWLESQAKGVVSDSNAAAEYLINAGLGFSFTDDPEVAKKDSKKILVNTGEGQTPTLTLTDEQQAEAIRLAKNQINSQLDSVVKVNAGLGGQQERAQTTGEINQDTLDSNINGYLGDLNVVLTDTDLKSAQGRLNKLIQQRNEQNIKNGNPVITNVDITDDIILVEFDGREPIRITRTEYDEKDEVSQQTSLQEDIASLYDVLSPFGDKEGYDLSATEVAQRVNDNITLGDRGKDRKVGFEEAFTPGATDLTSSSVGAGDQSISEYYRDKTTMSDTTAGDSMSEIQREMNKALGVFFDENMKTNFAQAGFTNPKIIVKMKPATEEDRKAGKYAQTEMAYITYNDAEGNPVEVELGTTKRNTPMEDLANYTATAINKINEAVNEKGGGGAQTFEETYPEWKKKNPGKTYQDFVNR